MTEIDERHTSRTCKGWVDYTIRALGEKASFVFLLAVALTFYEVVLRYFFNAPTTWVHEISIALTATAFIIASP